MEQIEIADLLEECARSGKYKNSGELAKHCAFLGASYKVMAWIDSRCLSLGLYSDLTSPVTINKESL